MIKRKKEKKKRENELDSRAFASAHLTGQST